VLRAAGDTPAALGGFSSAGSCAITPVRDGEEWVRGLRLATTPGTEEALLRRVAAGLPAGYHARVHANPSPSLYADAGDYVAVRAGVELPGLILVQISTGCRAVGKRPAAEPADAGPGPERAAVEAGLAALGGAASRWESHELSCAGAGEAAGTVRTVTGTQVDSPVRTLGSAGRPAGTPRVTGDRLLAVRDGAVDLLVRTAGGTLTVSATTGSCG
jgi:hypothetical protein